MMTKCKIAYIKANIYTVIEFGKFVKKNTTETHSYNKRVWNHFVVTICKSEEWMKLDQNKYLHFGNHITNNSPRYYFISTFDRYTLLPSSP